VKFLIDNNLSPLLADVLKAADIMRSTCGISGCRQRRTILC
jgi:predicted nuclease of predicted toxin-antitoxin system